MAEAIKQIHVFVKSHERFKKHCKKAGVKMTRAASDALEEYLARKKEGNGSDQKETAGG